MQLVLKGIIPRIDEIIWYLLIGTLGIVALNIVGIIDVLFTLSQTDPEVQEYIDSSFVGMLRDAANPLNGRLGNSVVWAFMGVLAFTLGSIAISELQDLFDHNEQAKETPRKFRSSVWIEFAARLLIRTLALIGLVVWVYFFFAIITPYASSLLLESLLAPAAYIWGSLALLIGGLLFGLSLYASALFCRFVALRVRVFSDQ
jgi:hypothetical protein